MNRKIKADVNKQRPTDAKIWSRNCHRENKMEQNRVSSRNKLVSNRKTEREEKWNKNRDLSKSKEDITTTKKIEHIGDELLELQRRLEAYKTEKLERKKQTELTKIKHPPFFAGALTSANCFASKIPVKMNIGLLKSSDSSAIKTPRSLVKPVQNKTPSSKCLQQIDLGPVQRPNPLEPEEATIQTADSIKATPSSDATPIVAQQNESAKIEELPLPKIQTEKKSFQSKSDCIEVHEIGADNLNVLEERKTENRISVSKVVSFFEESESVTTTYGRKSFLRRSLRRKSYRGSYNETKLSRAVVVPKVDFVLPSSTKEDSFVNFLRSSAANSDLDSSDDFHVSPDFSLDSLDEEESCSKKPSVKHSTPFKFNLLEEACSSSNGLTNLPEICCQFSEEQSTVVKGFPLVNDEETISEQNHSTPLNKFRNESTNSNSSSSRKRRRAMTPGELNVDLVKPPEVCFDFPIQTPNSIMKSRPRSSIRKSVKFNLMAPSQTPNEDSSFMLATPEFNETNNSSRKLNAGETPMARCKFSTDNDLEATPSDEKTDNLMPLKKFTLKATVSKIIDEQNDDQQTLLSPFVRRTRRSVYPVTENLIDF